MAVRLEKGGFKKDFSCWQAITNHQVRRQVPIYLRGFIIPLNSLPYGKVENKKLAYPTNSHLYQLLREAAASRKGPERSAHVRLG